jgi:voltage-gated potassium channel
LLFAWFGVMAVCSAWLYIAEHGVSKAVNDPFDAPWWGVVTLTTVGYGDVTPQTQEGRLAAMALMLLGIGLFGAITATITSYLLTHESGHEGEGSLAGKMESLATLHEKGELTDEEFTAARVSSWSSRRFSPGAQRANQMTRTKCLRLCQS